MIWIIFFIVGLLTAIAIDWAALARWTWRLAVLARRRAGFLLYAGLGPITGLLAYGLVRCLKARRPRMAAVYAVAMVEVLLLLGGTESWLLSILRREVGL